MVPIDNDKRWHDMLNKHEKKCAGFHVGVASNDLMFSAYCTKCFKCLSRWDRDDKDDRRRKERMSEALAWFDIRGGGSKAKEETV